MLIHSAFQCVKIMIVASSGKEVIDWAHKQLNTQYHLVQMHQHQLCTAGKKKQTKPKKNTLANYKIID